MEVRSSEFEVPSVLELRISAGRSAKQSRIPVDFVSRVRLIKEDKIGHFPDIDSNFSGNFSTPSELTGRFTVP